MFLAVFSELKVDCYRRLWWYHFHFQYIDSGLFIQAAIENLLRENGMCEARRHIQKKTPNVYHIATALKLKDFRIFVLSDCLSLSHFVRFPFFFSVFCTLFLFSVDHFNLVFHTM